MSVLKKKRNPHGKKHHADRASGFAWRLITISRLIHSNRVQIEKNELRTTQG